MKRIVHTRIGILLFAVLLLLAPREGRSNEVFDQAFQERANLAMRAVAHRMLLVNGDSLSSIPPIQSADGQKYRVQLKTHLQYDTLRAVVDAILTAHSLPLAYDLSVYDCINDLLILGFTALPDDRSGDYACQERDPLTECVNFSLRFHEPTATSEVSRLNISGWIGLGLLILGLGTFIGWKIRKRPSIELKALEAKDAVLIQLGNITFHPKEQWLTVNGQQKDLTYREAKLLHFFCRHPNEVLPRHQIIESVWGEEGVQVTRSLDVFVSRLRKILKVDPSIKISSVHGVGYRLLINEVGEMELPGGFRWPDKLLNHFRN